MAKRESLLDPRALRRIANLELVARQIVEGTLSGLHRSPLHGFGVEFLEHRPYVSGDDLRHLDWKAFAKTDRFFIRQHEAETNLRATVLLDASGSMEYASRGISKIHYAVRLAAALLYLLIGQQDSAGLLIFDRARRKFIPPRGGKRQLKLLLGELTAVEAGGKTDLASVLHELVPRIPRRGLLILVTDAFVEPGPFVNALARFHNAEHEAFLIQVLDREEVEFSFHHWTRFDCLEAEGQTYLVDPAQIRQVYLRRFRALQDEIRQGCHRYHIDSFTVLTDQPYDVALASLLATREVRK